jgi:hypothetical protein
MAKAKKSLSKKNRPGKTGVKGAPSKSVKPSISARYLTELCEELEKATAGLFHISERDCPYEFFTLHRRDLFQKNDKLTALEFLSGFGISEELVNEFKLPVDELIEVRTFDNFFPSIEDIAEYYGTDTSDKKVISESKRYRRLEALLRKRLHDINVFRVGKIEVRCYIAGFAKHGNIAGLVTTSIET